MGSPTPWLDLAACRGRTELFFAPSFRRESVIQQARREHHARQICAGCEVVDDCRQFYEQHPADARHAIYAGSTPGDRGSAKFTPIDIRRRQPADVGPQLVTFKALGFTNATSVVDESDELVRQHYAALDEEILSYRQGALWETA